MLLIIFVHYYLDTSCELPHGYEPQYVEAAWYDWWQQQKLFEPKHVCVLYEHGAFLKLYQSVYIY